MVSYGVTMVLVFMTSEVGVLRCCAMVLWKWVSYTTSDVQSSIGTWFIRKYWL